MLSFLFAYVVFFCFLCFFVDAEFFVTKNKITLIPSITILRKWSWPAFINQISHFVDFEQVINKVSHFANFEQVINKISHSATLNKPYKQYYQPNFLGRSRMPRHYFLRLLPCVTDTPPWLFRPAKASTSSELYPDTGGFFGVF